MLHLSVSVGPYSCTSANAASLCDAPVSPALPPTFHVTVDFGDGSPAATWTPQNGNDVFRHSYSVAGRFQIVVTSEREKHTFGR